MVLVRKGANMLKSRWHRCCSTRGMTRTYLLTSLVLGSLAGCAGDQADSGGNVGFGGAQDIGQFRDILSRGEIPGPETLDANGFFNEHYTELPKADCGSDLCLHGMVSVSRDWVRNEYQAVLRVALNTSIDPAELTPKPLDLVVVVDTSGSMQADDRLSYVQQGLSLLIDELGENDRLGIVSYSSEAALLAGFGEHTREDLHAMVDGFVAAGGTNIYEGMRVGLQMASENVSVERQTRLILLSDGVITEGRGENDVIVLSEDYVSQGIGLTTIGVGDDFNVDLMRGLAERGAGNFYYLEDPSAVTEVFTEELSYFVQPLALDLEVTVQADPSHSVGEVLGTRLWASQGNDGGRMSVPALFLSSRIDDNPGENGRRGGGSSLFIEMQRRQGSFSGEAMATIQASYRLPGSDEIVSQEIVVDNPFREQEPEAGYVSHIEMLEAYAMYNVFLGLRQASVEAQSDYNCALQTIEELSVATTKWSENNPDYDLSADLVLMRQFSDNLMAKGAESYLCGQGYPDEEIIRHCSAGGGTGGMLGFGMVLLALVWVRRRRHT